MIFSKSSEDKLKLLLVQTFSPSFKIIELFNPSNTLAAQTYMIIFIILFIQFRPRGIFALKGRVKDV